MSSKLKLVSPLQVTPESSPDLETDWTKCVICMEDKNEKLVCPANSKKPDVGTGYVSLAKDVTAFDNAGCLPRTLRMSRIDDGSGVEATLEHHRAKFHKSCRLEYSKPRLERVQKRKNSESSTASVEKKPRREQMPRQQNTNKDELFCLFCEKPASTSDPLHEAMTKVIGERVKRCATKLLDKKLLAKVSSGDLVASDAKYHAKCLVALYNAAGRMKTSEQTDSHTETLYARAFAELSTFVEDTLNDREESSPVFKLSDLVRLYRERVVQLGVSSSCVHSTRLKDRILASFPELRAFKDGRDILLTSNEDIGGALRHVCENDVDNDAYILAQAARIVRREIMNTTTQFDGTFSASCQVRDLPQSLQTLVAMLCDGASITEQSLAKQNQAQLSICQLIVFNSFLRRKKQTLVTRHIKSRELPLPMYLGIFLHNKTRKRELVDRLYELGLSVSYDRVLEISTDLGTKICKRYESLNTVCPPQLKKGIFTSSAVDNINHQTSATTAKSSFNGTGISVFQHFSTFEETAESEPALPLEEPLDCTAAATTTLPGKSLPKLPLSYTRVTPVTHGKLSCAVPSMANPVMTECPLIAPSVQLEYRYDFVVQFAYSMFIVHIILSQMAQACFSSCQYGSWHIHCILVSFPCK